MNYDFFFNFFKYKRVVIFSVVLINVLHLHNKYIKMQEGTVKFFNEEKGFGITPKMVEVEIFCSRFG